MSTTGDQIRAGDRETFEEFRHERRERVRAYCAELCVRERTEEAQSAAFMDFLARVDGAGPDQDLEELLLEATRSAAAARARVAAGPEAVARAECEAMPELLAAEANGELTYASGLFREHLRSCAVCQETAARMRRAERAFGQVTKPEPEVQVAATPEPVAAPEPQPEAVAAPGPQPEPPAAPEAQPEPPAAPEPPAPPLPPPIIVRRRSGGLVGTIRKARRRTER